MQRITDQVRAIAEADGRLRERTGRVGRNRPEGYVEVRDPVSDKLLFEVAPERAVIRIRRWGAMVIFSLASVGLEYVGSENIGAVPRVPCVVDKRALDNLTEI